MNDTVRKLLSEKLIANRERSVARFFIERLPASLQETLRKARVIVAPESFNIADHLCADVNGEGVRSLSLPPGFSFAALQDASEVFETLKGFGVFADAETAHFRPTGFFPIETLPHGPGELPVFEVNFGWARHHLINLHALSNGSCALVTTNGEAGIITSVVCGYQDRHADEKVFELAYWGAAMLSA